MHAKNEESKGIHLMNSKHVMGFDVQDLGLGFSHPLMSCTGLDKRYSDFTLLSLGFGHVWSGSTVVPVVEVKCVSVEQGI